MTFVTGDAVLGGRYSPAVTSRERSATSTGVLPKRQLTNVGGATLMLKDRMRYEGSLSLGFVDGMNDTSVTTGLGTAVTGNRKPAEF